MKKAIINYIKNSLEIGYIAIIHYEDDGSIIHTREFDTSTLKSLEKVIQVEWDCIPWSDILVSSKGLPVFRFLTKDDLHIGIVIVGEDKIRIETKVDDDTLSNQFLDLYQSCINNGVYFLELEYSKIREDDINYEFISPINTRNKEEIEELFKELKEDGYVFKGETDTVYYPWQANLKDYTKHKYYLFENKEKTRRLEIVAAPIEDAVEEEDIDEQLALLEEKGIYPSDSWWVVGV